MVRNKLQARKYRSPDEDGGTPTAPAAEPAADTSDSSAVQEWEGMAAEDGDGDVGTEFAAETESPAPAPAAPAAPATPPVAPVAAEPPVPPQAPTQQPQEQQAQAPQAPAEAPVDIAALRQNYFNELSQYYALAPEDAQRLQTEPELVLPTLAAKVHLEVLDAVMAQLPQRMTMMMTHYTESTRREQAAEEEFFAPFPDLKAHKDAVLRVGQMYRAANPKATKEQAIQAIGNFVRQSLGLPNPAQQQQQAPIAPVNPFTPAGSSGAGAPPAQMSEWEFLAQDDD